MKKLNRFSVIMIVVAALGVVFSIVGFFVPWFTFNTEMGLCRYGLFEHILEIDFPIPLLQSFAIITLIFDSVACALYVLYSLYFIKIKWAYRIACAAMVILSAVLMFIFAIMVTKEYGLHYSGIPLMGGVILSIGPWFLLLGAMITCIPILFYRRKSDL